MATHLQLSLNCLMMFEIFSYRCWSVCSFCVACEITRNVAFSNSTTSSAFAKQSSVELCLIAESGANLSEFAEFGEVVFQLLHIGHERVDD